MCTLCTSTLSKTKMFYFRYMCIWRKSGSSSCSGKLHTVIKQITRAAWRKAASNCICWIQSQQHSYPGSSLALPRGGKTFKPVLHYPNPGEELPWTLKECPPTWPCPKSLGECSVSTSWLIIHNLQPLMQGQNSFGPHLHHHCLCGFICISQSKWGV